MRVEAQLHTRATRSHLGPRTLNLDRNIDPKHFPPNLGPNTTSCCSTIVQFLGCPSWVKCGRWIRRRAVRYVARSTIVWSGVLGVNCGEKAAQMMDRTRHVDKC